MKKLTIILVILLIYTTLFPSFLFAQEKDDDRNEKTEEAERSEESNRNSNPDKPKDQEIVNENSSEKINSDDENELQNEQLKESNDEEIEKKHSDKKSIQKEKSNMEPKVSKKKNPEVKAENEEDASKKEAKKETYNELGIRIGTEVYGEDISKLSKDQLQYIPKGWRDGVIESEHPEEENSKAKLMRSSYPDVNNYIKNLSAAKVQYEYKGFFEKFNYRNGHGAVEGVVAHETANDNSNIFQEISFMSKNHENAFVHAFVDHERVIQIHPLDYGAWGAGRFANQRFVHVELVHVNNFDQFARSINNYANYIANILYDYNLGVSSAEKNGKGTLWSHKAVSSHLGGTTHVDPHGYFARYGYNWNDFVNLVTKKHHALVSNKKVNTSKIGHIKSSNVRVYSDPSHLKKYTTAGSKNMNEVFYIKTEAKLSGTNYYLLSREPSSKKGTIGWVKSSDINAHAHSGVDRKGKTYVIKGNGKAYNKAWGGSKNLVYNLSSLAGQTFKVNLTEKVGSNVWYRGILKGKTVWIHSSYVGTKVENKVSKLGHIRNANVKIYKDIYKESDVIIAGTKYTDAVYYIKKESKINGDTFYLISKQPSSSKGIVGWVNEKDMSVHAHKGIDKKTKKFITEGNGKAYSKAWGGSSDLVYDLSLHAGSTFKVNLTESVGNNIWYRGTLEGKQVWIHSSYVIDESKTSKLGHFKDATVTIHPSLYDNKSTFKAGEKYTNAVYYIKKQAKVNGKTLYLLSTQPSATKGVIGWVNAKDLSIHDHKGVDKNKKTYYIKGTGSACSKAWGGAKDLTHADMSKFANQEFKVNLTEKVGNNTWYRGSFNGETIWLHSSYVTTKEESNTSKLGHIRNEDVKIHKSIGNESSAINAGKAYTNAVYYIKKQAMLNGQTFYLISNQPSSSKGIVGWVNAKDLSTHKHIGVDKIKKTLAFKGTGSAYSKAWGGFKDLTFKDLAQYKGQKFNVHLTEKVGNNIWYRGDFKGKRIWLHSSYVN